jgi:2-aminoethylphosphonate-pyruvate transaminase
MKSYVLLNPGPTNLTERVHRALHTVDLCHREVEYFECQNEVRERLLSVFGLTKDEYVPVLLTGSGTAAMEAAVCSGVAPGDKLLVVNNGVYGDRLLQMARAHGIPAVEVKAEWTARPDLREIERLLDADREIRALAVVHHETTTGLLNPVNALGALARARKVDLIVDTISGLAGEVFDFDAIRPAYTICTANKCVQGYPGICFVLVRREALARAASYPPRSVYLNLPNYWAKQEKSDTPFTPAIQVMFALREALRELAEETVAARVARYARAASVLRQGCTDLGLELLLPAELRSNTITTIKLPAGMSYTQVHDALKERGFVIYGGQGDLGKTCFRLANMGAISDEDLHRCVRALGEVVRGQRGES